MEFSIFIPVWVLYLLGIPLATLTLLFALIGIYMAFVLLSGPGDWWH
jgi:hypothetical protein